MNHMLDRPIWSALDTRHAALAEGGPLAKRYQPSISLFTATRDETPECLDALARLPAGPDERLLIVQAGDIRLPPGLREVQSSSLVQMMADTSFPRISDPRIKPLGPADAADMLELATLTKPGPFSLRAQSFGRFWGIRIDGRLAAMSGERLKQPGFTELSGVCTHPDVRGQGLGRLMSLFAAGEISAMGEVPYLHAYATNTTAIGLYERIGFSLRSPMNLVIAALEV